MAPWHRVHDDAGPALAKGDMYVIRQHECLFQRLTIGVMTEHGITVSIPGHTHPDHERRCDQ